MAETDKKKLRSFVKELAKSPEEIKAEIKAMEEAKKQYTQDVTKLEANLKKFNETLDPLIDPATNEPLCWVRRPSQEEWEAMIPAELFEYENIEDVPKDTVNKIKDRQFEMMATLIMIPKHDAEWWKKNSSNLVFQELFQMHIVEVYRKLGVLVGNF
jgi:chromosome segregation ATPase